MQNKLSLISTILPIQTLITEKHNPYLVANFTIDRSVLSYSITDNLPRMLSQVQFDVTKCTNNIYGPDSIYYILKPYAGSEFAITASGATNNIILPNTCDLLVLVSGYTQGYHFFGETTQRIAQKLQTGDLSNPIRLL